jgi:hypothetical protein
VGGLDYATSDTLAYFRIALGLVALANAASLARESRLWLFDQGVAPSSILRRSIRSRLSLYLVIPATDFATLCILALHATACVLLTLGLASQFAALIAWLTLTTLHARNCHILYGGDSILRTLLLLSCAMPLGEARGLAGLVPSQDAEITTLAQSDALALARLQIVLVYVHAFIEKLRNPYWRRGEAVGIAIRQASVKRFALPERLATQHLLKMATYGALVLEAALPIALCAPQTAGYAVIIGILFHLCLDFVLAIHLFSWIMISGLLLFLPLPPGSMPAVAAPNPDEISFFWIFGVPFLALATVWPLAGSRAPKSLRSLVNWLWLGQRWNMFCSTTPFVASSELEVSVLSRTGTTVHFVWRGPEATKPLSAPLRHRFAKFANNLASSHDSSAVDGFVNYAIHAARIPPIDVEGVLLSWKREVAEHAHEIARPAPSLYLPRAFSSTGAALLLTRLLSELANARDVRLVLILALAARILDATGRSSVNTRAHLGSVIHAWKIEDDMLLQYVRRMVGVEPSLQTFVCRTSGIRSEIAQCAGELLHFACGAMRRRESAAVTTSERE